MNLKLKDNPKLKLTSNITQLEYIESTGTQYIDTGLKPDASTKFELVIQFVESSISNFFGCRNTSSCTNASWNLFDNVESDNKIRLDWLGEQVYSKVINRNENCTITLYSDNGKGVAEVNNMTYFGTTTKVDALYNAVLFGCNNAGSIVKTSLRISRVTVYSNSNIVQDLIACLDYAGIVCMYDTVSKQFFYNQGTGDFVAGPIVYNIAGTLVEKITTLYHKNCPNIDGYDTLKSIQSAQVSLPAVQKLNRVRVDVGNISGSLSELIQYSTLAGFNDAYEPQTKPRLVGTWTVNDWYTTDQLAQTQAAFDGLTIVEDPNYVIDFSQLAVQTLDSAQPNYNPAAAIILKGQNLGTTLNTPVVTGGGRWFLSKTQAAAITDISVNVFKQKTTVTDTFGIVSSDTSITYNFESFVEFKFFTGITKLSGDGWFYQCTNLRKLILPQSITRIEGNQCLHSVTNAFIEVLCELTYINLSLFMTASSNSIIHFSQLSAPTIFATYMALQCRYTLIGYGTKHQCEQALYNWSALEVSNKKSWYSFSAPQISYDNTNVTLSVERTSDIYYTLDGSTPTLNSTKYTQPFSWDGIGVIKAMSYDENAIYDKIVYSDNFYSQTVATPVISKNNGNIEITCDTAGTTIYYTYDGTYPTTQSNIYSGPINIQEFYAQILCFAVKDGMNESNVASKLIVIDESYFGTTSENSMFALQSIDSSKPNFNPVPLSKITHIGEVGNTNYGFITKSALLNITTLNENTFRGLQSIELNGNTYRFTSFDEFRFFNLTSIGTSNFTSTILEHMTFPSTLTSIGHRQFYLNNSITYVHLLSTTPPTIDSYAFIDGVSGFPIYVGDGSSAAHDNAILADYQAASSWSSYTSRLNTWYNYLHPTT